MKKPVINLSEITEFTHQASDSGKFESRYAGISELIGAKDLGYNLSIVPSGKTSCPFHNHRVNEELFIIIQGSGTLRYGDKEYPLKENDIIACPPGDRKTAHQILNTGESDLKYLGISTKQACEICEYPDSDKIMAFDSNSDLRHMTFTDSKVEYLDGEV